MTSFTVVCKETPANGSLKLRQLLICWSDYRQVLSQCIQDGTDNCYISDSNLTFEKQTSDSYMKDFRHAPFTASWFTQVLDVVHSERLEHYESNDGDCEYVLRYSPNGQILAIAVNHLKPLDSLIVFVSQPENVSTAVPFYQPSNCPECSSGS